MQLTECECVGCDLPCFHGCPYRGNTKRLYCDECMEETDRLYVVDGRELCRECAIEELLSDCEVIRLDD